MDKDKSGIFYILSAFVFLGDDGLWISEVKNC